MEHPFLSHQPVHGPFPRRCRSKISLWIHSCLILTINRTYGERDSVINLGVFSPL